MKAFIDGIRNRVSSMLEKQFEEHGQMMWKQVFQKQQKRWEKRFPKIKDGEFGSDLELRVLNKSQLLQLYRENYLIIEEFMGDPKIPNDIAKFMRTQKSTLLEYKHAYDQQLGKNTTIERFPKAIFKEPCWAPVRAKLRHVERDLRGLGTFDFSTHTEGHVSVYHENDDYGLHLDDYRYFLSQFIGVDTLNLEMSLFYYANPNWKPDHGGRLELQYFDFQKNEMVSKMIDPKPDTLVIFPSKLNLHGVEVFKGDQRITATFWMHDSKTKALDPQDWAEKVRR